MKNGFWDRVLIFLYVLLTVALVALLGLQVFGIDLFVPFYEGLEAQAPGLLWKLIVCGIGTVVSLLGIFVLVAIMPGKKMKRDFITLTNDENGQVRIALPALKEMAAQAVGSAAGVKDMAVDIAEAGDAITVAIALDVVSGTHVPTITMNMQRAVRSYIQMNCGVAVKNVSVVIHSVLPAPEGATVEPRPVAEAAPEKVTIIPKTAPAQQSEEREIVFTPVILPADEEDSVDAEEADESAETDEPAETDETAREKAE
jgi:uncharacterized alkaline shock family protein YloU